MDVITVEMVRDKGFEFVEGDWLLPQDLHGNSCSFEVNSITARWLKKHAHWGGTEVEKFAWRDNKGEMPCDGELLVEVETASGGMWHVSANVINWPLNLGRWNVVKWRPSFKNWESEMNIDKIETQEEKEAFDIMSQDNERLQNYEMGKGSEIHNGLDWKNGEECYVKDCSHDEIIFVGLSKNKAIAVCECVTSDRRVIMDKFWLSDLLKEKPETLEQKAERERMDGIERIRKDIAYAGNELNTATRLYDLGYSKQNG